MSDTASPIRVATYNIHKGFSQFNRRMMVHDLREQLRLLDADIVFLQEVQGEHARHEERIEDWPAQPQYEYLADAVWSDFAYGRNAVYDHGHHGNAILSRYPIVHAQNRDVSSHGFEARGLLHCAIAVPGYTWPVHCVCVHLALHERGRRFQVDQLVAQLQHAVPPQVPVVIAGDFNDWRNRAGRRLCAAMHLTSVHVDRRGKPARSFPSAFPVLRLDRIYVRGFRADHAQVHAGAPWSRLSDHAALSARLIPLAASDHDT